MKFEKMFKGYAYPCVPPEKSSGYIKHHHRAMKKNRLWQQVTKFRGTDWLMSIGISGSVAQAVKRSPPTAGVPSLHVDHYMWVSWWTKRDLARFFSGFLQFLPPQISFHNFPTLISSILFHFIRPCDGASGMVGRHPCYSRIYNIGASSRLIPRPDLMLDMS